jgi:hypothetical protein
MEDIKFALEDENISIDGDIVLSDDEIKLTKNAKQKKKKTVFKPKKQFQQRPSLSAFKPPVAPRAAPAAPPQMFQQPTFTDKTFEAFSNPQKRMPLEEVHSENEESNDEQSEAAESAAYGEDFPGDEMGEENRGPQPSPGFNSIEDEKQDLLYKFHRLESKGIKLPKKYNMYSDVREMRSDFERIKRDHEVNGSIKFSRRMLMAVVSASEFLNKRYDPFGLELNGWSETVMENTGDGDYDNIFERLHDKYSGKVNTPPELELMLSLAGSAIMFHMTSTMFKSIPNLGAMAQGNPEMQQAMSNLAQNIMKQTTQQAASSEPEFSENGRRKMKGPSMNLSGIGNMMPPPMPSSSFPQNNQVPDIPESIISDDDAMSDVSGLSVKQVSVTAGGTKRGRKPKVIANKENTIEFDI